MMINDRIKEIRIKSNLNQTEFAEKLNLTQSAISAIERGTNIPSMSTLESICNEFNVDGTWLLTGKETVIQKNDLDLTEHEYLLIKAMREWQKEGRAKEDKKEE